MGTSDEQLAAVWKTTTAAVRHQRAKSKLAPVFKRVDTCAAEFESFTPYLYSTYEDEDEAETTDRPKIAILGSGPNRIGQGIEFDYCCCHASFALREDGYETIMVNCNPETVSTDYGPRDRPLLRAAHPRKCSCRHRSREAGGSDRAIRRADAAESGAGPQAQRRADYRHRPRIY